MPRHFMGYMKRDRITDWKRKSLTRDDSAFIYGTRDDIIFPQMERDDVLWIAAPVPHRPPEIVARLDVEVAAERDDPKLGVSQKLLDKFPGLKWFARGSSTSRFFGHNNAERAFMESTFFTPTGKPWSLDKFSARWQSEFGTRFQRPVELAASCGQLFQEVTSRPAIFISWKWKDNRKRLIRDLAYSLADQGFSVWFDQLAMPASESLRRMKDFPKALEELLRDGYCRSSIILAIESRRYGIQSAGSAKNWTLDEWNGALDPGHPVLRSIYRPPYGRQSDVLTNIDYQISGSEPMEAAKELKIWHSRIPAQ